MKKMHCMIIGFAFFMPTLSIAMKPDKKKQLKKDVAAMDCQLAAAERRRKLKRLKQEYVELEGETRKAMGENLRHFSENVELEDSFDSTEGCETDRLLDTLWKKGEQMGKLRLQIHKLEQKK